jgi:lincosamide nucleotidyltransferase A/C/D/E
MLVGRRGAGATPRKNASSAEDSERSSSGAIPLSAKAVVAERARQFIKHHPVLMRGAESFWRAVDSVPAPFGTVLQSVKQRMLRETGLTELLSVIESLESEGISYWLAGGWGVDALLGRRTRRHKDIDVVIEDFARNEPKARTAFLALGFAHVNFDQGGVWMPKRSNFEDDAGHRIEVLDIDWECVGRGLASDPVRESNSKLGREELAHEVFTVGRMEGREVPCLTARAQLLFHTGFTLEASGRTNVALLRSEFGPAT